MRAYQEDLAFTGAAAQASANPAANKITGLRVEPYAANTHVGYISINSGSTKLDITASPPAGVTKRLAPPSSATAIVDAFEYHVQDATSRLTIGDFHFGGTSTEGVHITWFEG